MSEMHGGLLITRSRPQMPDGYGVPDNDDGMLDWAWADQRLAAAANFWFSSVTPDGRPHAVPAWGVWLDGRLYFEGSPLTRRMRNLRAHPYLVAHLESAGEVLILEGPVEDAAPPSRELAERLVAVFEARYGESWGYHPQADQWDQGGLWQLRPVMALGWTTDYPRTTTRWHIASV